MLPNPTLKTAKAAIPLNLRYQAAGQIYSGPKCGRLPDPNWLPEVGNTTPDPAYPGAHAVISAAGASVLISRLGKNHFDFTVTSEVLAGVDRSFESFSAASEEATLSRIFAGVHFRSDLAAGHNLGRQIADFVVDNFLTSVHGRGDSADDK